MRIKEIKLENFRNYGRLDLNVGPSVNIFHGNNAQGKTNVIEAISYCSSAQSCRLSKDREVVKFGENSFSSEIICVDDDGSDVFLKVSYNASSAKKSLTVNNAEIRKIGDFINICNTVIFTPDDLNTVKSSPVYRRRFVNSLITKISPSYINLLYTFQKLNDQKSKVLKNIKYNPSYSGNPEMELDIIDMSLADCSAEIIINRERFVLLLADLAKKHHFDISGGKETLEITYTSVSAVIDVLRDFLSKEVKLHDFTLRGLENGKYAQIKDKLSSALYEKYKKARQNDMDKGASSIGIHRDDLLININGNLVRDYSSQGQQRSAALSMKMAELEIVRMFVSSTPILLLDDVFSEFDFERRQKLVGAMKDAQIFITCTDKSFIDDQLDDLDTEIKYFRVENGQIFPE